MARKPSSVKSASGAGYSFEDYIAGHFALSAITGEVVLGADFGIVSRLDFYTRASGWLCDDLLITFSKGRRLSLSAKSNQQITSRQFPREFLDDAWEQFLEEQSSVFDERSDYIGIATATLPPDIRDALDDLQNKAGSQDEARFLAGLRQRRATSDLKRDLFASLASCTPELKARHKVNDHDAVRLLRRLVFLDFDFNTPTSPSSVSAVRTCQRALTHGGAADAAEMWTNLTEHIRSHRHSGGYTDVRRIVSALNKRFELKQWPEYEAEFCRFRTWTASRVERIPDTIGWKVRLPRTNDVDSINKLAEGNRLVAVVGPSGCGKSVILKQWCEQHPAEPLLFLDGAAIVQHGLDGTLRNIGINHSIGEIARGTTSRHAFCVIDGAGLISSQDGYKDLAFLIRSLCDGSDQSPWHLILVCQDHEWSRLYDQLNRANGAALAWKRHNVANLRGSEHLDAVWNAFPALRPLSLQRDLQSLLLRPKVLDMIASRLREGKTIDTEQWIGETSVAQWFWQEFVDSAPKPAARSRAACSLAELQADEVVGGIRLSQLPVEIDDLRVDNLVIIEDGRVGFQHDLYGDWTRLQILLDHKDDLANYVEPRLVSPFWNRALRLYGLYLLEYPSVPDEWAQVLDELGSDASSGNLGQDLILEAVIFAANPLTLLERIWSVLQHDEGKWLKRLLNRFLFAATEPNPVMLRLAKTPVQQVKYASANRDPWWPHWLPMLSFLDAHHEEVVRLAGYEAAQVAKSWLSYSKPDWPKRQEAARIAISVANETLDKEYEYRAGNSEADKVAFQAGLACYREAPSAVEDLLRRAAGRLPRPRNPRWRDDDEVVSRPFPVRKRENVVPWPHGPLQEPNEAFAEVCTKTNGLFPLIDSAPDLASEIILSVLIKVPSRFEMPDYMSLRLPGQECKIEDHGGYYPPFWWHYPWVYFLNSNAEAAIRTIVSLVDFAALRRSDSLARREDVLPAIECVLPGIRRKRRWIGDEQSYIWYTGVWGPPVVSSALMALEFWLYQQLDLEHNVDEWLLQISSTSETVPFLGLLACVACKRPDLLQGKLAFLMAIPEVMYRERRRPYERNGETALIAWMGEDASEARKWHGLEHRSASLEEEARKLFFSGRMADYFARIRKIWSRDQERSKRHGFVERAKDIERLVSMFNPADYNFEYSDEHKGILVTHEFPTELAKEAGAAVERATFGMLLTSFPMRCRRILDGEQPLSSEDEIEAFWDDAQRLTADGVEYEGLNCKEDIACGTAAVLICTCSDWLSAHSDHRTWCVEALKDAMHSSPDPREFDSDMDKSGWQWHSFCAEAIPLLWVDQPGDEELRSFTALLALDRHYETVCLLFRSILKLRERLGDQYHKLAALTRLWARERPVMWRRQDAQAGWILRHEERPSFRQIIDAGEDALAALISEDFLDAVDAFVDDRLPSDLPSILIASNPAKFDYSGGRSQSYERPRLLSEVDTYTLQSMYRDLPPLHQARNETERAGWIDIWQDLLECILETLRPTDDESASKKVDGLPYETDRWVLGSISVLITQMRDEERPDTLCKPIIFLSTISDHWVQEFISDFLIYNVHAVTPEDGGIVTQRWVELIEYALSSPAWSTDARPRWDAADNWERLLGMHSYARDPWPAQYASTLAAIQPYLKQWVAAGRISARSLASFLRLMQTPAAASMRVQSLTWVEPLVIDPSRSMFRDSGSRVGYNIGMLLAECWQYHADELRRSKQAASCFHRLVKTLADRQDPIGLELQNRVIAG